MVSSAAALTLVSSSLASSVSSGRTHDLAKSGLWSEGGEREKEHERKNIANRDTHRLTSCACTRVHKMWS